MNHHESTFIETTISLIVGRSLRIFGSQRNTRLCRRGAQRQREQRLHSISATSAPSPLPSNSMRNRQFSTSNVDMRGCSAEPERSGDSRRQFRYRDGTDSVSEYRATSPVPHGEQIPRGPEARALIFFPRSSRLELSCSVANRTSQRPSTPRMPSAFRLKTRTGIIKRTLSATSAPLPLCGKPNVPQPSSPA